MALRGGGRRRCGSPGSWPRSWCCPSRRRAQLDELRPLAPDARPLYTAESWTRWRRRPGRRRARPCGCTSRSTPACTASAPRRSSACRWPGAASPAPSCAGRACGPTWPWPTSPPTRTRLLQLALLRRRPRRAGARRLPTPPLVHAANSGRAGLAHRPPAATWCGPASRSTGSRRAWRWPRSAATRARRCRCAPG